MSVMKSITDVVQMKIYKRIGFDVHTTQKG